MVFSSTVFLCAFLPAALLCYFLVPGIKAKNVVLLIFSLFFYAWGEPTYVILMVVSVVLNYLFGIWIHHLQLKPRQCRFVLFLGVIANLSILFYFKYFTFALTTMVNLLGVGWTVPEIALPIGISFYTFQGMSYVIDVYRDKGSDGKSPLVQKNIIKMATYISMFPQLIAGPIVRYGDIHEKLDHRTHSFEAFAEGAEIFIIGLAKKVVFANILGSVADKMIEGGLNQVPPAHAWVSALLYMLQIFYDFSGYSDMAIGLGKIFGFDFPQNFNYPYISRSVTEFWRRWHISLSTWFRDYLYIPLGGNRRGNVYFNLSVVFLATGIWHGADGSFLIWGMWHGMFMLIERVMRKKHLSVPLPKPIKSAAGWLYTMLVVYFGWIVFRLASLSGAIEYIKAMFGMTELGFVPFDMGWYLDNRAAFVLVLALLCCIPWKQIAAKYIPKAEAVWSSQVYVLCKRFLLLLLLAVCFVLITNSSYNPFIYFRF